MEENKEVTIKRSSRLDINRDAELMHRFVKMNLDDNEIISEPEEEKTVKFKPREDRPHSRLPDKHDKKEVGTDKSHDTAKKSEGEETPEPRSRRMSTVSVSSQGKSPKLLAKLINQELKKKRKRRRMKSRRHEEIYTDKDRAAAMSMGSKDIKTSLKAKRKQDRSKALCIPEEAEPGNFIALGNRELKCGKLKLSFEFYNKALELNPEEKNALVARSQCHIMMGHPELALQDAEAALALDKTYVRAIFQKAESLYYLGEFEHSLVYYHRGLRIRPDLEGFKLGVHKAQKAIENAIGKSMISRRNTPEISSDRQSSSRGASRSTHTKRSKSSIANTNRLIQVPKQLCIEMKYLDGLLKHPDIKSKLVEETDLKPKIQEAVDYLHSRQKFWKQQLPPNIK